MVRGSDPPGKQDRAPAARVVVLGASNVARGLGALVAQARRALGPADLLVACGRGRSYGWTSRFFFRDLPPIVSCGLWPALAERDPLPLHAVLTDVGNDVLYGATPAEIARWVETCLSRLAAAGARISVTALPLERLQRLGPRAYAFWSTLFYPGRARPFDRVRGDLAELDERLGDLAHSAGARRVVPPGTWYGLDPIHIRPSRVRRAWAELLPAEGSGGPAPRALGLGLCLNLLAPEERALLGRVRRHGQPARCFGDGTRLSLF